MTTSNLSIVDSLIRSHFGSNLWTKSSDVIFFNDDRIKQISQCLKDLPVKSKLYILMALGNLETERFYEWRKDVDSIFLRAMVEGNLLVRAIATILQQKFSLNYLTFDISLSLDNFAEILNKLSLNLHEWDVSGEIRTSEYISENVVNEMMRHVETSKMNGKVRSRKRKFDIDEEFNEEKEEAEKNLGCRLKNAPRSYQIKEQYLKKIEAECNKKRVRVPIPGRNKLPNKIKEDKSVPDIREMLIKSVKESEQQRKDLELEAKLQETKKKLSQKNLVVRKETKLICLSAEDTPLMGPKARQIIKEREKEAKKTEKEEKMRKLKEERELEKIQKQEEKERKRLAQKMLVEQSRREKDDIMAPMEEETVDEVLVEEEEYPPMVLSYNQPQMTLQPQINAVNHIRVIPANQAGYQFGEKMPNIRIVSSQSLTSNMMRAPKESHMQAQQQQPQQQTPVFVFQSPSQFKNINSAFSVPVSTQQIHQPNFIISNQVGEYSQPSNVKLVRIVNNQNIIQQQTSQPQIFRIINPSSTNSSTPSISISSNLLQQQQQQQQPQMTPLTLTTNTINNTDLGQQLNNALIQQTQINQPPQSMHLETMKILVRYANRLTRPQKAMIVSFIAGSADGVDFNGQSSVHLSSHRALNSDTYQALNLIVDAFFLMDYQTGRWSIVKQYREPRTEEELLGLDLQPDGYPPEFSGQP